MHCGRRETFPRMQCSRVQSSSCCRGGEAGGKRPVRAPHHLHPWSHYRNGPERLQDHQVDSQQTPNADPWLQRSKSPVGNPQLIQFSREMVDLMKNQPSCLVPITKFIPAYHHHFAKQCRVSDYGFSKLLELLEAVPHVLQILGLGSKRLLTLTHRAQIKRFTQDLLKLLKFQASKQVVIGDFTQAYHWCFSRNWQVVDYGMCDLMDLLAEIPDTTITVSQQDGDMLISVPKRGEALLQRLERFRGLFVCCITLAIRCISRV